MIAFHFVQWESPTLSVPWAKLFSHMSPTQVTAFRAEGLKVGAYICPSLWNSDDYWQPVRFMLRGIVYIANAFWCYIRGRNHAWFMIEHCQLTHCIESVSSVVQVLRECILCNSLHTGFTPHAIRFSLVISIQMLYNFLYLYSFNNSKRNIPILLSYIKWLEAHFRTAHVQILYTLSLI